MRTITYAEAIAEALAEEMRRDPAVVVWGLDVGPYGGAFAATKGLAEEFGPERVIDMPISEAGYVGAGVGGRGPGSPSRGRTSVLRLDHHRLRHAGQPGGQDALHVRR